MIGGHLFDNVFCSLGVLIPLVHLRMSSPCYNCLFRAVVLMSAESLLLAAHSMLQLWQFFVHAAENGAFEHVSVFRSLSKKEQLARTETPRSELGTESWAEDDEQEVSRYPPLAAGRNCQSPLMALAMLRVVGE